ncbi:hypothetical protein SLEP1_g1417 [Rubroshorea leprosula]|uniref:Heparan-alpha-glucosaminide N-acetyltransferase catalytic domain-containing protein n=1 Tax=Rubroshorea leprosula TaxID=152421 RepID=A0AAV5HMU5_9ROSI|nr:hypothetical protein SLEP1_g1417 [Rubroshorea leprosula]
MLTVLEVRDERREPLLHHSSPPLPHGELTDENEAEIISSSPSGASEGTESSQRIKSTPLISRCISRPHRREFTSNFPAMALMILVNDTGGAFPSINHSPWFGVTIADFVMPFFLFGVGVSISLVLKKASSKLMATKKVVLRAIKLFLSGLLLQGGHFHGCNNLTYAVDVDQIQWLGVLQVYKLVLTIQAVLYDLQRISIGYLLTSVSEIRLVNNIMVDSAAALVRKYYVHWIFALLLLTFYMCLLYGLYVPNWEFQSPSMNVSVYGSDTQITDSLIMCSVCCGVRGSPEPPCNAVG